MSKKFKDLKKKAVPTTSGSNWQKTVEEVIEAKPWKKDVTIIALKIMDTLEEQNMTQKELASILNITPQAVNKIIKAKQNLTIGTIRKLEEALGISLISLKKHSKNKSIVAKLKPIKGRYNGTMNVFRGNINSLKSTSSKRATKTILNNLTLSA